MTRARRCLVSSRAGWGPVKDTPRSSAGRAPAPQNHRGTFGHSDSLSATLSKPGGSCQQNLCSIFGRGFADILIIKSALAGRSASGRIQANRSRPTSVGADFFDWGRIQRQWGRGKASVLALGFRQNCFPLALIMAPCCRTGRGESRSKHIKEQKVWNPGPWEPRRESV